MQSQGSRDAEFAAALARADRAEKAAVNLGMEVERLKAMEARRHRILKEIDQDIRTPVTPIFLELHLLGSGHFGALGADAARALSTVRRNVDRWAHMTERLLSILEDERPMREPAAVDVGELDSQVAHDFSTRAIQDGIRLHDVPPQEPLRVHVPPEALRQAVTVLLDHALSSTPAGGHVTIMAHREAAKAVLEIQDGGPGLTKEELAILDHPESWSQDGPARWAVPVLRVALLVEAMGGKLSLESDGPGLGICRVIELAAAD